MCIPDPRAPSPRQRGITFIELIIFIMVVGIGVAGILLVYSVTLKGSTDPMVRKQLLAVAEAVMEEAQLMAFTICDPDDSQAATAASSANCTGGTDGANDESKLPLGPETGEIRGSNTTPFDNVSDYHGYSIAGITDIAGNAIPGLGAYSVQVTVSQLSLNGIPAAESLSITVTASGPGNQSLSLSGFRTRYAPNAVP
ncbi:MAG: type IV pilus modification PilV family protein [Burkholderiales bacterium]